MKFKQKLPLLNLVATGAPTADDDISKGYSIGSLWESSSGSWRCTSNTTGAAIWAEKTSGGTEITDSDEQAKLITNTNWSPAKYGSTYTGPSVAGSEHAYYIGIDSDTGSLYLYKLLKISGTLTPIRIPILLS